MDKIQFAEKEQKKKGRTEDGSGSSSLWHPNIKNSYTEVEHVGSDSQGKNCMQVYTVILHKGKIHVI